MIITDEQGIRTAIRRVIGTCPNPCIAVASLALPLKENGVRTFPGLSGKNAAGARIICNLSTGATQVRAARELFIGGSHVRHHPLLNANLYIGTREVIVGSMGIWANASGFRGLEMVGWKDAISVTDEPAQVDAVRRAFEEWWTFAPEWDFDAVRLGDASEVSLRRAKPRLCPVPLSAVLDEDGNALVHVPAFVATVPQKLPVVPQKVPAIPASVIQALKARKLDPRFKDRYFTFSLEQFEECEEGSVLFIATLVQREYVIEGPYRLVRDVPAIQLAANHCIVPLERAAGGPRVQGYDVAFDFEFKRRLALILAAGKAKMNALTPLDDHISEATWKRFEPPFITMKTRV